MTSPSPDIESLIAAFDKRHRKNEMHLEAWPDICMAHQNSEPWPCPDRLLLDALVPVYEAARRLRAEPDDDFDGQFVDYLVPHDDVAALRAALGEPNA